MSGIAKINSYINICSNRHNCTYEVLHQIFRSLKYSLKIYSVVHIIQTILYKRSNLKKE